MIYAGVGLAVAHGLGDLAATPRGRRTPPCCAAFSSASASGSYSISAANPSATPTVFTTRTVLSVSVLHLFGHRDDVLVVRQHDHGVGRRRFDRFEDLRGRRVHRLAAGHDLLHAEAAEDAADALAGRDRRPPRWAPASGRPLPRVRRRAPSFSSSTCSIRSVTRIAFGPTGVERRLDGGADVVGVDVAVPEAFAADDHDRVADAGPHLA